MSLLLSQFVGGGALNARPGDALECRGPGWLSANREEDSRANWPMREDDVNRQHKRGITRKSNPREKTLKL